jgi:hypothetical protein
LYRSTTNARVGRSFQRANVMLKEWWQRRELCIYKNSALTSHGKWNYGSLSLVKSNMYYTHYPRDKIHFIKGKVEDTLPITKLPEKIALLRLDTDWYDSTLAELNYLWDRLVPEGLLTIDNFCTWGGSRKAKFFRDKLGLDAVKISEKKLCMDYWKKEEDQIRSK